MTEERVWIEWRIGILGCSLDIRSFKFDLNSTHDCRNPLVTVEIRSIIK
jgi:hypothetical protein